MAIGTVTWGAVVVGTTGTLTPAQPSPAAGDLLLCFCYDYAQLTSWTQPAGWSTHKNAAVTSSGTYAIFYKVATGSEGTATVSCAATGTGNSRLARICKVPGASSTFVAGAQEAETANPYANAGVTPTVDGSLVVFFGGTKDCITNSETDGFGTTTGGTNCGTWTGVSNGTTGGSDAAMGVATCVQSTAAATGSISRALQASQTTYAGISYTFAVAPASGSNYAETGTAAGEGAVNASDVATRVESGAAAGDASVTAANAGSLVETGSASGEASVTAEDTGPTAQNYIETGTASADGSVAAADVATLSGAGTAAGAGSTTATDTGGSGESGSVAGAGATTAADTAGVVETATAAGDGVVTAADAIGGVNYNETGTASGDVSGYASDSLALGESGNITVAGAVAAADVLGCIEAATAYGIAFVLAIDWVSTDSVAEVYRAYGTRAGDFESTGGRGPCSVSTGRSGWVPHRCRH